MIQRVWGVYIKMRAYIGVTDKEWFQILASLPDLEEINFWQPCELFLFKLHSPDNYIVGGGIFAYSSLLPVSLLGILFRKRTERNPLYKCVQE
jgi:putative restriction endonuclease